MGRKLAGSPASPKDGQPLLKETIAVLQLDFVFPEVEALHLLVDATSKLPIQFSFETYTKLRAAGGDDAPGKEKAPHDDVVQEEISYSKFMSPVKNRIPNFLGVIVSLILVFLAAGMQAQTSAPAADEAESKGRKLLAMAIAALGGEVYLTVNDFTLTGRFYQIYHGATSGAAVFVDYVKYPDKERQEIGKKKESILINNGDRGWDIDYRAVRFQTAEQIENYIRAQKYSLDRLLRFGLKSGKYRIYYDGTEYVQPSTYDVVILEDTNREKWTLLLNTSTHLPEALRYKLVDPKNGGVDKMESWLGNFQRVQGIMTPFHRERIRNGQRIAETFVNDVKYNTGLSDALFVVP